MIKKDLKLELFRIVENMLWLIISLIRGMKQEQIRNLVKIYFAMKSLPSYQTVKLTCFSSAFVVKGQFLTLKAKKIDT